MALEIKAHKTLIAEKEKRMVEYHAQLQKLEVKDEFLRLKDARIMELNTQVNERDTKINILEFKLNLIRKSGLGKIFKVFKSALK
jgi:predicted RNase H-like nuclease (RuvC/YqgF family)